MARGIQGIQFMDSYDLEVGQVINLPDLNGCKVYGVKANGLPVWIKAEISGDTKNLGTGIKWAYGEVTGLTREGISWHSWYHDANANDKKDPEEKYYDNPPLEPKFDLWKVGKQYTIQEHIKLSFKKSEDFKPNLFYVEPFLLAPEGFLSKQTKGFFVVPVDFPKPYHTYLSFDNVLHNENISVLIPSTKEDAQQTFFYYGDIVEVDTKTLLIPDKHIVHIQVINEEDSSVLYESQSSVKTWEPNKTYEDVQDYLYIIYGNTETSFLLDISKKPASQKRDQSKLFKVEVAYYGESLFDKIKNKAISVYDSIKEEARSRIDNLTTGESPKIEKETADRMVLNEGEKSTELQKQKQQANKFSTQKLTGYIQIKFDETETYLKKRNEDVNQMVQKKGPVLKAPGCDPCHYTQILGQEYKNEDFGSKKGHPATLFDENEQVLPSSQPVFEVIAGETNPAYLKLQADLHTKDSCKHSKHSHGGTQVFKLFPETGDKIQNLKIINLK